MTSKITFGFIKDSTLHLLGALDGATPIAVDPNKITYAVTDVLSKLITRDATKYQAAIQDLSHFSVTIIDQSSLKIESGDVVIHLKKLSQQTAALFLNAIQTPEKSTVECLVEGLTYLVSRLVEALTYVFSSGRHFTKWTKYRLIQDQLEQFARDQNVRKLENSAIDPEITTTWNSLIDSLLEPTHFETPDDQYRQTVKCLRKDAATAQGRRQSTQAKFESQLNIC